MNPRPPFAGQSRALAPTIHPTQSVVPAWHILNLIGMSGPSSLPAPSIVTLTTTEPSNSTDAPPATPRRPSRCFQRSSCLIGCLLSLSLIPAASFSFSSFNTNSSVVELTAEPPSNMIWWFDSPIRHLVWYWKPELSLATVLKHFSGKSVSALSIFAVGSCLPISDATVGTTPPALWCGNMSGPP